MLAVHEFLHLLCHDLYRLAVLLPDSPPDDNRVPLKTIQERLGHALTGSLTLDVYTHPEWKENEEAAKLAEKR